MIRSTSAANKRERAHDAELDATIPHSWDVEHWPVHVYPHTTGRARYLLRMHRKDLLAARAIARIGREIVIIGAKYSRWLASQTKRVSRYEIPPNRANGPTQ